MFIWNGSKCINPKMLKRIRTTGSLNNAVKLSGYDSDNKFVLAKSCNNCNNKNAIIYSIISCISLAVGINLGYYIKNIYK